MDSERFFTEEVRKWWKEQATSSALSTGQDYAVA
jgi:hypothetical protein